MEGVLKDPIAGQANVTRAFERPRLRPRLQKYHLGTIYGVRLHQLINCVKKNYKVKNGDML